MVLDLLKKQKYYLFTAEAVINSELKEVIE